MRSWQVAYRGIVPDEYLDSIDEAERVEQWAQILRGEVPVGNLPLPLNIVAEDDGEVVGFANVGAFRQPDEGSETPRVEADAPGELWAMYVTPERWGTGAGGALMAATIDELRAKRYDPAYLWVLTDNDRARRFYERQGWVCDDVSTTLEVLGNEIAEIRYSRAVLAD